MPSSRIVGGMFGLELGRGLSVPADDGPPPFLRGRHLLLATGRSAFTLLHRAFKPARVWLPSHLCGVVIPSFSSPEAEVRFYAIDDHLLIADDAWLDEVQAGDLVVFNDYFGFNLWDDWGREARRRGAWIVEDACQALLNDHFSQQAHYVIFSPRKFVGVPDGGVLLAQGDARLPGVELPPVPVQWWLDALTASVRRAEFDRNHASGDRSWFELFQRVEPSGPLEPCAMSELSRLILRHGLDWHEVARRRRDNYRQLAEALREMAIFPDLPDGVVPLGFPVRMAEREAARQRLFAEDIYPPVHWPIEKFVPSEFQSSHRLARWIMTLPCDQRCSLDDLDRALAILRRMGAGPARVAI